MREFVDIGAKTYRFDPETKGYLPYKEPIPEFTFNQPYPLRDFSRMMLDREKKGDVATYWVKVKQGLSSVKAILLSKDEGYMIRPVGFEESYPEWRKMTLSEIKNTPPYHVQAEGLYIGAMDDFITIRRNPILEDITTLTCGEPDSAPITVTILAMNIWGETDSSPQD